MTQSEADAMDPQHRILLEVAYESLEDGQFSVVLGPKPFVITDLNIAGIPISSIAGSDISCFAGGFSTGSTS